MGKIMCLLCALMQTCLYFFGKPENQEINFVALAVFAVGYFILDKLDDRP